MHLLRWQRHNDLGPTQTHRVPIEGGEEARRARRAEQARIRRDKVRKPRPPLQTPEERRARKRAHRLANLEAERERQRRWNAANKRIKAAHQNRRRARSLGAAGDATPEQIAARIAYFGGRCWICRGDWQHMDHVKPLIAGGCNWPSNLRPICASCNSRKGRQWPYQPLAH